jgi:hypothetical protein
VRPLVADPIPGQRTENPWTSHAARPITSTTPSSIQPEVINIDELHLVLPQLDENDQGSGRRPSNFPTAQASGHLTTSVERRHHLPERIAGQQFQLGQGPGIIPLPGPYEWSTEPNVSTNEHHQLDQPVVLTPRTASDESDEQERSEYEQQIATIPNARRKARPMVPNRGISKPQARPGRKFENQWRIGQAPNAGLKHAKEQTNFNKVLAAVSRYYQGNADGVWKLSIHRNAVEYVGKGLTEAIGASVIMAAGLVAAGQVNDATMVLHRTLPLAEVMLLSQHPQVCFWLVEISMDTSHTVAGSVRRAIKAQFGPIAARLLGPDHPASVILQTPLTIDQQMELRKEGQKVAHDHHVRTFGTYSYQTMAHQWYWGRIAAAQGRFDEAVSLLQDLTQTWEQHYSTPNSVLVVTALVEQARVMVASGEASVRVECMLSDALRRMDVISSAQHSHVPLLDAAELRLSEGRGLIYSRLAALRALGRVHVMRWNLGAAVLYFQQAVQAAHAGLPEGSSARKLCEADLEAARMMDLERAMGVLAIQDLTSRLPPISSIVSLVPIEP